MKRKKRFSFLLLLGAALLAAGLIGMSTVPDLVQYAFTPPAEKEPTLYEKYQTAEKAMGDAFPVLTLHGMRTDVRLSFGETGTDVTVYAVGPSWTEAYPRPMISGRPLTGTDAEKKSRVIVLDGETAFRFFGTEEAEGRIVEMDGQKYEVVGVARHERRIGEKNANAAWVPLDTLEGCGMLVLSAPSKGASWLPMFRSDAQETFGTGTAFALDKEKKAAMFPLLVILLVAALWAMRRWIAWLLRWSRERIAQVRAESRRRYLGRLLPYAAGKLALPLLLAAATVAACYGIAVLAVSPAYVFPEYIPDSLGDFTSWVTRFWDLVGAKANPVSLQTPELAEVGFWAGPIRWGTLLILLGAIRSLLAGRAGKTAGK